MPLKKEHITNQQRAYWEVSGIFIYYQLNQLSSRLIPHPTTPTIHLNILYGWGKRYYVPSSDVRFLIALKKGREKHGNGSHDGDTFNLQLQSLAQSQV